MGQKLRGFDFRNMICEFKFLAKHFSQIFIINPEIWKYTARKI